ncbi:hypothetical protein LCGC14_0176050 [marine sediment metagenome]|uniref:Uncharacterized protein n=1 Tax=marine sediment metagenome TaxID=412755 RepID=A0A0F9X9S4_9ZZZZ
MGKRTAYQIRGGIAVKARSRHTVEYAKKNKKRIYLGLFIFILMICLIYYLISNITLNPRFELYIGYIRLHLAKVSPLVSILAAISLVLLAFGAIGTPPHPAIFIFGSGITLTAIILFYYANDVLTGNIAFQILGVGYLILGLTWLVTRRAKDNIERHGIMILSVLLVVNFFVLKI